VSPRKRPELIEGPDDVPGPTLGDKIEWLIRHRPDGSGAPATNADVALSITAVTGEELSSTGIWKLRTGRGENPTLKTMTALATFFSVPLGFFGEDEDALILGDQAALAALLREKGVSRASLRALTDLSVAGRRMVEDMIESVARMERERDGSPELPPIARCRHQAKYRSFLASCLMGGGGHLYSYVFLGRLMRRFLQLVPAVLGGSEELVYDVPLADPPAYDCN
jgi:transcriptional regulator with XRE-family HTH domain